MTNNYMLLERCGRGLIDARLERCGRGLIQCRCYIGEVW